jgi:RHS repeat-associated protein
MISLRVFLAVMLSMWCTLTQAQYFDAETGLHYNNARYYDPKTGRSISADRKSVAEHVQRWQENMGSRMRLPLEINPYVYVANNPIRWVDPTGLATFLCKKPLDALGGEGTRSGPDVSGNPLYHQYVCIKNGKLTECSGQDRATNWPYGPGKPSNDKFDSERCEQEEPDNDCIEQCLIKEFAEPRPWYGLVGPGTNCQEWVDDVVTECRNQCKKK